MVDAADGKPVFVATNAYYPSTARKGLGNMSLDNASCVFQRSWTPISG
jgi:hypothetical protein